jgi:hypothetical protein
MVLCLFEISHRRLRVCIVFLYIVFVDKYRPEYYLNQIEIVSTYIPQCHVIIKNINYNKYSICRYTIYYILHYTIYTIIVSTFPFCHPFVGMYILYIT